MTSVTPTSAAPEPAPESVPATDISLPLWAQRLRQIGLRVEKQLQQWVDHANPILVKETRQALVSRQFAATFLVVLAACWIASIGGVVVFGPEIYYAAPGAEMLLAYYTILAFPLTVIVPYSAFRSLASEQEENTYDLLSITTLTPKQIVNGKFGSAVVQMLLYLSAVSPCIAFTFLLRGIDFLYVATLLGYTVLASLGLIMLGILIGTLSKIRYSQVLLSVLLVLALAGTFALAMSFAVMLLYEEYSALQDPWFWVGGLAALTLFFTTFMLIRAAAVAQLTFSSGNRSTSLRRWMFVQQACFIGWIFLPVAVDGWRFLSDIVAVAGVVISIYWYLMGTLLTGEWPHLSHRVKRTLPQSTLGRVFLTWFNPGSGTGYMFCVANLTAIIFMGLVVLSIQAMLPGFRWIWVEDIAYLLIICWGYVVAFLGLGRLLVNLARRWTYLTLLSSFLLHIVLLLLLSGVPVIAELVSNGQIRGTFSSLEVFSPFLTLVHLFDGGTNSSEAVIIAAVVVAAAVIFLLLNLRSVAVEVGHHRVMLPVRVAEEEAVLHPSLRRPTNPWEQFDEETPEELGG